MTVYDSSVLISYLNGEDGAVRYVREHIDERAVALPIVVFEVYQGEVFKSGAADFDAVDGALEWLTVIENTAEIARSAAELQTVLHEQGSALAARDTFIAGTAMALDERLVVADSDFDVAGISDVLDVDLV
ncbi:PIN domain-containing protein [Natrarchaeobius chitinivorans]|uniref:Ribonuclease VapC n=1 Tax=Natrarchaeobius chitinivorans TaxID=1679083 RepID=A0A3N6P7T2_NATCH|nr:PIN domain-containing protein [Natrarchaeobius chitinivorans]RQG94549.1 PIN domain-containing protein [Natrarchaeobius chitinivorans]